MKVVNAMTTLCSEAHFPQKALKLCSQLGHLIQPLLLKASLLAPFPAHAKKQIDGGMGFLCEILTLNPYNLKLIDVGENCLLWLADQMAVQYNSVSNHAALSHFMLMLPGKGNSVCATLWAQAVQL